VVLAVAVALRVPQAVQELLDKEMLVHLVQTMEPHILAVQVVGLEQQVR
jgi:galactokinase